MKLTSQRLKIRTNHLTDMGRMNLGRQAMRQAVNISHIRSRTMAHLVDTMDNILMALYEEMDNELD